ncbi:atrophin-1 isoform X2 [Bubalus bubalis]|uniref:atrophin-1 isoform X2 n=1 Tax=Bubalus bubalis TaxID=89462 RepID=UPI001D10DC06|nr:atrophin-1 isoform X2 [Bubalus bubalis]
MYVMTRRPMRDYTHRPSEARRSPRRPMRDYTHRPSEARRSPRRPMRNYTHRPSEARINPCRPMMDYTHRPMRDYTHRPSEARINPRRPMRDYTHRPSEARISPRRPMRDYTHRPSEARRSPRRPMRDYTHRPSEARRSPRRPMRDYTHRPSEAWRSPRRPMRDYTHRPSEARISPCRPMMDYTHRPSEARRSPCRPMRDYTHRPSEAQVQEGRACPSVLELPTVLLQMERSRRAQEQLLWDLELLTGAGLGLFWPPWAQFCGLRAQVQHAQNQHSKPYSRTDDNAERLSSGNSRLCPPPQTEDSLSQNHQLLEGGRAADPPSAPDLNEASLDADPRQESPGLPEEGPTSGCFQELNATTSSSPGEPGNSEFKDLAQKPEGSQAEPTPQRPNQLSSRSLQEKKLAQGAPGPPGLPSPGLPEPQDPLEGLGWSLGQERAEQKKLLRIEIPHSQREGDPQGQGKREKTNQCPSGEATQALMEEVSQGQRCEGLQGEHRGAPQGQSQSRLKCGRKEALPEPSADSPRGSEEKIVQSPEGRDCIPPAWEEARGEGPREKGGSPGDFCRSLGERMGQPGGRAGTGPQGRPTQLMQVKTDGLRGNSAPALGAQGPLRGGLRAPLPLAGPPTRPLLPGPGAVMLAAPCTAGSRQRERPAALPGHLGPLRDPHSLQGPGGSPGPAEQELGGSTGLPGAFGRPRGAAEAPRTSKTAWPEPLSRDRASASVSAAQQASALQRLLELNREARRRRQRDREQQRLRVLERLRIARNRHCRVHPLEPPPSPAQLPPQEDAAGRRRALREQLEQTHRERTGRLRALGARNTQNFQQLLWPPGAAEPDEHRSPF